MENDPPYKDLGNFIDDFSNIDSKKMNYPKRKRKNKYNYADDFINTKTRISTDLRAEDLIQIVYRLAKRNVDPRFRKAYREQLFKLSPSELEYELKQVLKYYSESDIPSEKLALKLMDKKPKNKPVKKKKVEIPENIKQD